MSKHSSEGSLRESRKPLMSSSKHAPKDLEFTLRRVFKKNAFRFDSSSVSMYLFYLITPCASPPPSLTDHVQPPDPSSARS